MTRARSVRVLVAERHFATRAGMREPLEAAGLKVVAEAANADDAARRAGATRPAVSLVSATLPGGGVSAIRAILERNPGGAVVILGDTPGAADLLTALRAGASGHVSHEIAPERLAHLVRAVAAGELAVPRALVGSLLEELGMLKRSAADDVAGLARGALTERENVVLTLLAAGSSTAEIALRLGVSPVTVRRHVSRVLSKLNVPDRAAAVALVRREARRVARARSREPVQ